MAASSQSPALEYLPSPFLGSCCCLPTAVTISMAQKCPIDMLKAFDLMGGTAGGFSAVV
jgi:hypothetical protein